MQQTILNAKKRQRHIYMGTTDQNATVDVQFIDIHYKRTFSKLYLYGLRSVWREPRGLSVQTASWASMIVWTQTQMPPLPHHECTLHASQRILDLHAHSHTVQSKNDYSQYQWQENSAQLPALLPNQRTRIRSVCIFLIALARSSMLISTWVSCKLTPCMNGSLWILASSAKKKKEERKEDFISAQ